MTPNNTDIFIAYAVPNEGSAERAGFSICIELNPDHKVFNSKDAAEIKAWKEGVLKFHAVLAEKLKNLQLQINNVSVPATLVAHPEEASWKGRREAIWAQFLGFQFRDGSWEIKQKKGITASTGQPEQPVIIEQTVRPVLQSTTIDVLSAGRLSAKADKTLKTLELGTLATTIKGMITPRSPEGTAAPSPEEELQRNKALKDGINNAVEAYVMSNARRQQRIVEHANNQPYYNSVKNEMERNVYTRLEYSAVAAKMAGAEHTKALKNALEFVRQQALVELLENEPEYIRTGLDELNKTPLLRRFFQTLIDVTVEMTQLPAPDVTFFVKPVINAAEGFLNTSMKTMCRRSKLLPSLVLPQISNGEIIKDNRHLEALLKIGSNVEVRSYEQESVKENAIAALAAYNKLPEGLRTASLTLDVYQKQSKLMLSTSTPQQLAAAQVAVLMLNKTQLGIARAMINRISNIATKGQSVYLIRPFSPLGENTTDGFLYMSDVVSGYAVFARKKGSGDKWVSLTAIQEKIDLRATPGKTFLPAEQGVDINVGVQSTSDGNGTANGQLYDVKNNFLFFWEGTKVGAVNPMQQHDNEKPDTTQKINTLLAAQHDVQAEITGLQVKNKRVLAIDWFPFQKRKTDPPELLLQRIPVMDGPGLKLKFGEAYEYLMAVQLPNGYVPLKQAIETASPAISALIAECKALPAADTVFKRHEHINQLQVSLASNIYQDDAGSVLKKNYPGESPTDLVIRSGTILNNDSCTRYILPPQVPGLQIYLWYKREGRLKDVQLSPDASEEWYRRYQCELENEAAFKKNLAECEDEKDCKGCRAGCARYCKGKNQGRVYSGQLQYLPDPVVTGFIIRFYGDPDRKVSLANITGDMYKDTFCAFNRKNYPQWRVWEFVLLKDRAEEAITSKVSVDSNNQRVTIRLRKGMQLYLELIPTFLKEESLFFEAPLLDDRFFESGTGNDYSNPLYSNITKLTLTHACQLPVIVPALKDTMILRNIKTYDPQKGGIKEESFKAEANINFEHLNLWRGIPMEGLLSTGELAFYGLWDDYADNSEAPHKSIQAKRNSQAPAQGFIRLDTIKFAALQSKGTLKMDPGTYGARDIFGFNHEIITFTAQPELTIPHHSDLVLKVRNTSRFSSYFLGPRELTDSEKEQFSTWSAELLLRSDGKPVVPQATDINKAPYLFNNKKSPAPVIAKIIPLKVTDIYREGLNAVRERNNRIRIYFERTGMQITGKGQRIGLVTDASTSPEKKYVNYFESINAVSQAGSDIVTVRPTAPSIDSRLSYANFSLSDEKNFDLRQEANMPNLLTFKPKYDKQQDLWYLDVDINITNQRNKEPHAVFVQLNFVHFQTYAANYNALMEDSKAGYDKDYRLSDVVQADFAMINPSRTYYNHWSLLRRSTGKAFSFAPETESLYFYGNSLQTQFFVFVQQRVNRNWYPIASTITGDVKGDAFFHSILPTGLRPDDPTREWKFNLNWKDKKGTFRIVMMEIDYFYEGEGLAHLVKVMDETGMGDRFMPTDLPGVLLRNTFIISESDDENLL